MTIRELKIYFSVDFERYRGAYRRINNCNAVGVADEGVLAKTDVGDFYYSSWDGNVYYAKTGFLKGMSLKGHIFIDSNILSSRLKKLMLKKNEEFILFNINNWRRRQ